MKKLIILLGIIIWLISPLSGQTNIPCNKNTIAVKGIAILKQKPEILTAGITIKVTADKFNPCQEKLIKAVNQAKNIFIKRGIAPDMIHTNDLNISEKRDYLSDGRTKLSYEGNSSVTIEQPYSLEFATKLLAGLQNDSVPLQYSIDFTLSESQKKELRRKAISTAVADAREKAEALAESANIRLLKIKSIIFTDEEMGRSYESDLVQESVMFSRSKNGSSLPVIDFNPKEIGIRKSVTIEWEIEEIK